MKKRFGILTYHNANNYGAVLQAYALQRFLKDRFGEECVEVIDYQCEGVKRQRRFGYYMKGQNPLSGIIHFMGARKRINNIEHFCRNNISLSDKVESKSDLRNVSDNYDYLVSGSDQVWNRKWTGGEDTYLQDFYDDSKKKASYAASFGIPELLDEWKEDYQKLMADFSFRSVREEAGRNIIKNNFGLDSDVHVDPSVLLTGNQWDRVALRRTSINRPFVLAYMVPHQESVLRKAEEIAKTNDLKMVVVCRSLKKGSGVYKGTTSVEEVIALFREAEYVVTNSFHGTAFSVIYQKKFFVELNNKIGFNERSAQLLRRCGILDIDHPDSIVDCTKAQWDSVQKILNCERKRTEEYFEQMN